MFLLSFLLTFLFYPLCCFAINVSNMIDVAPQSPVTIADYICQQLLACWYVVSIYFIGRKKSASDGGSL